MHVTDEPPRGTENVMGNNDGEAQVKEREEESMGVRRIDHILAKVISRSLVMPTM